ncbi:hypothetical protein SAMN04487950_3038 [Halogranum rubrum]|uniref:DUF7511 domain-containing protein n=2 Tax=Halogranum rubrum TaxID=553466 RepID=A0A1I4G5C8_9EURY|nr:MULTISPECIES: hypothetical protein [Halogranum]EJN59569.1 hypothetical protein HSB1_17270 [Halogranum salarium B-1]SFL24883.1 hypothetical protein SAMN04487950_3038 [Halogranum rubrum]
MSTPDNTSEAESSAPHRAGLNRWPVFDVEYVIESSETGRDQCTLYPRDIVDDDIVGAWLAADEGSYVSLAETR